MYNKVKLKVCIIIKYILNYYKRAWIIVKYVLNFYRKALKKYIRNNIGGTYNIKMYPEIIT